MSFENVTGIPERGNTTFNHKNIGGDYSAFYLIAFVLGATFVSAFFTYICSLCEEIQYRRRRRLRGSPPTPFPSPRASSRHGVRAPFPDHFTGAGTDKKVLGGTQQQNQRELLNLEIVERVPDFWVESVDRPHKNEPFQNSDAQA